MNELQKSFRAFLNSAIPLEELAAQGERYSLPLGPGATFLDALKARAAQFAEKSPEWAKLTQGFSNIRYGQNE